MKIKLNKKEELLLEVFAKKSPLSLAEMSNLWRDPQSGSWARNSLRKLVREKLVRKIGRGSYQVLAKGRRLAATLIKSQTKTKKAVTPSRPKKESVASRILDLIEKRGPLTDEQMSSRLAVPQPSIRRARRSLGSKITEFEPGFGAGHQTKWGSAA